MSSRITIDQTSRNVICSVVFVDLVEYSKKSVAEQLDLKDRFTALLAEALTDISINDRIVLDTGDGAAMSFLGDPEDALFVGMSLRDALKGTAGALESEGGEEAPIRIGINLGPVRLVRDINGHPNIVGDGINVAQRIMSFAQPGQILASRSYYDVVSCLSDEYAKLFSYEGSRTDKHVREHDVYVVGESEKALKQARSGLKHRAAQTHPRLLAQSPTGEESGTGASLRGVPLAAMRSAAAGFLRDRRKVMTAGAVLGALVVALAVLLAAPKPPAPVLEEAAASAVDMMSAAVTPSDEPMAATENPGGAKPESPVGVVKLSIDPWGEVFVNGKSRGVSPPMKTMKLAPGKYKVEVRNTTLKPYAVAIEVKSREEVTVGHVFN
jgi:class 3 adenylate cyclase